MAAGGAVKQTERNRATPNRRKGREPMDRFETPRTDGMLAAGLVVAARELTTRPMVAAQPERKVS
jgi:hypothetical protein